MARTIRKKAYSRDRKPQHAGFNAGVEASLEALREAGFHHRPRDRRRAPTRNDDIFLK